MYGKQLEELVQLLLIFLLLMLVVVLVLDQVEENDG